MASLKDAKELYQNAVALNLADRPTDAARSAIDGLKIAIKSKAANAYVIAFNNYAFISELAKENPKNVFIQEFRSKASILIKN